jgi:hypothetical protein
VIENRDTAAKTSDGDGDGDGRPTNNVSTGVRRPQPRHNHMCLKESIQILGEAIPYHEYVTSTGIKNPYRETDLKAFSGSWSRMIIHHAQRR